VPAPEPSARVGLAVIEMGSGLRDRIPDQLGLARSEIEKIEAVAQREDGAALASVAAQASGICGEVVAYGYEQPELASLLLGAHAGELLGPMATEDGWRLVQLRARTTPDATDPTLRARAIEELLEDALAPHLSGRVEWNVRL